MQISATVQLLDRRTCSSKATQVVRRFADCGSLYDWFKIRPLQSTAICTIHPLMVTINHCPNQHPTRGKFHNWVILRSSFVYLFSVLYFTP